MRYSSCLLPIKSMPPCNSSSSSSPEVFKCTFEKSICNLKLRAKPKVTDLKWQRVKADSISNAPVVDHSKKAACMMISNINTMHDVVWVGTDGLSLYLGGRYLTLKPSGGIQGDQITAEKSLAGGSYCLEFWYFLFGRTKQYGSFKVVDVTNKKSQVIWTNKNKNTKSWTKATVSVKQAKNHKVSSIGRWSFSRYRGQGH